MSRLSPSEMEWARFIAHQTEKENRGVAFEIWISNDFVESGNASKWMLISAYDGEMITTGNGCYVIENTQWIITKMGEAVAFHCRREEDWRNQDE